MAYVLEVNVAHSHAVLLTFSFKFVLLFTILLNFGPLEGTQHLHDAFFEDLDETIG